MKIDVLIIETLATGAEAEAEAISTALHFTDLNDYHETMKEEELLNQKRVAAGVVTSYSVIHCINERKVF
jgi:hypothetical protein